MVDIVQAATSGIGVYTVAEAARYARMPPATLRSWFFGDAAHAPIRRGGVDSGAIRVLTFVDFVEALAVRSLRVDHKLSLQKIREGVREAEGRYGIRNLFARKDHRTVLIGRDLHIFLNDDPDDPVQLTGRNAGQKSMKPCIEAFMRDLAFDEHGMARLYKAYRFEGESVVMNPKYRFGEPVIESCGYSAETLWRAAVAEGSIEKAADLYEVPAAAVETAYRYCHGELGLAA